MENWVYLMPHAASLIQNNKLWPAHFSCDLSLPVRWGNRPALMSWYYTCQSLDLSHSQPNTQQDRLHGPAHSHWHAICDRSAHAHCKHILEHGHANTFNFQRDADKMYKVTAGQNDCLDRQAETDRQGRRMSWKWQGVITSQHSLTSHFTAALFHHG